MKRFKDFMLEVVEKLEEESASGHPTKRVEKWMTVNGYTKQPSNKKGAHPKYTHNDTGHVVTGSNDHGKVAKPDAVRNMMKGMKSHLADKYVPLDPKLDRL